MKRGGLLSIEDVLKASTGYLKDFISASNVIGEPIEVEDKVMMPVAGFGFGYGGGGGKGDGDKGSGTGVGGGGGVKPMALIIVYKGVKGPDGVQVLSLKKPSPIVEAISESIPHIIEAIKMKKTEKKKMK